MAYFSVRHPAPNLRSKCGFNRVKPSPNETTPPHTYTFYCCSSLKRLSSCSDGVPTDSPLTFRGLGSWALSTWAMSLYSYESGHEQLWAFKLVSMWNSHKETLEKLKLQAFLGWARTKDDTVWWSSGWKLRLESFKISQSSLYADMNLVD